MVGSLILIIFLLFPTVGAQERNMNSRRVIQSIGGMGAIIDHTSLIGRQERVAFEMAIEDSTMSTGHNLSLHVRDSSAKSFRAASNDAAQRLVQEDRVQAVIEALTSEEMGLVAEIMDDYKTRRRFRRRLRFEDPDQHDEEEDILGRPGFFALRAYDAAWTAAAASERKFIQNNESQGLLGEILGTNFTGLSNEIGFKEGWLSPKNRALFRVINVIGNKSTSKRKERLPFYGSYDDLVEQIYLKNFHAVVGDMEITVKRYRYVDFAQPYTESGLVMVVTEKSEKLKKAWLFLRPITKSMWILMVATNVFIGVVVWFIDRKSWRLIVIACSFSAGALVVFYRRIFHYYSENWSQTWMASMDRKLWNLVMINLYKTHMKEKPRHQPRRSNRDKHRHNSAV